MSVNFNTWRELEDERRIYRDMEDAADYHWRIDEGSGAAEITCEVTGEIGTINGATWVEDATYPDGWALEFNGSGDWVQFDIQSLGGGEDLMWVSVAFETTAPDTRGVLASVVDPSDADRWNFESGSWDTNGSLAWWMSGDSSAQSDPDALTSGTPYHGLGIHDNVNGYRELVIDGTSVDETDVGGAVPGGEPTTFKIGRRGSGSREFEGRIGEVMIGFTELSDYEKGLLYERMPFSQ